MTSDLDEKLKKIIFGDTPEHFMSDHMLSKPEQIKQAFIDAGWADLFYRDCTHHELKDGQCDLEHDIKTCLVCGFICHKEQQEYAQHLPEIVKMTGQEWYDRFSAELGKPVEVDHLMCGRIVCADHAIAAAKKAAGIE